MRQACYIYKKENIVISITCYSHEKKIRVLWVSYYSYTVLFLGCHFQKSSNFWWDYWAVDSVRIKNGFVGARFGTCNGDIPLLHVCFRFTARPSGQVCIWRYQQAWNCLWTLKNSIDILFSRKETFYRGKLQHILEWWWHCSTETRKDGKSCQGPSTKL